MRERRSLWCLGDLVAVTHPHVLGIRLTAEQHAAVAGERSIRRAVLTKTRVGHLAAESPRHHLEAVADAERRDAEIEDATIERGRTLLIDRRWTAGEDERDGVLRADLGGGGRVRHDLAVHARLADATGDELRILGAEVDDENGALGGVCAHRAASWVSEVSAAMAASRDAR